MQGVAAMLQRVFNLLKKYEKSGSTFSTLCCLLVNALNKRRHDLKEVNDELKDGENGSTNPKAQGASDSTEQASKALDNHKH